MYKDFQSYLQTTLKEIEEAGLYKNERVIVSPQRAAIKVSTGKDVLNFCANNYLGLSDNQELIDAAKKAMTNVYWAICPLSNIFIHNALPPVQLMRENGLKICIGTDSLSSNDDLDMMAELKCLRENFPQVPAAELLKWASTNGAEFLGRQNVLGTLAKGKRPGIVLVTGLDGNGNITGASRSKRIV